MLFFTKSDWSERFGCWRKFQNGGRSENTTVVRNSERKQTLRETPIVMSGIKLNRSVLSPSARPSSSPEHTLEVMQRRLQKAENETKRLVDQLTDYGFSTDRSEKQEQTKSGWIEPVTPFKPTVIPSTQMELLQRNYESIVSRVCRAESTIQSLKLALCSLEAEKNLENLGKDPNRVELPKGTCEDDIRGLKKDLSRCKKELQTCEQARKEAKEKVNILTASVEKLSKKDNENALKMEELRATRQKLTKKVNDVSNYYV